MCQAQQVSERRVKAQFETFLEAVPDAMVVVDRHGRIVMLNSQTERLFGYRREQLLGLQVELLVPERYRGSHGKHREGFFTAPTVRPMGAAQELQGRGKDGSEFPVEISLSPIEAGQGILVASAIRDITDRKRAEAQRASLIREHAARAEAEAANRAKDEFLAMLSHELRNPLGAVLSAVAVLDKMSAPEEPAPKARAIIRRQAERLSRMLDDLLDVARLQTGKIVLTTQRLDAGDLVRRCLGTLRASGSLDQHDVTTDCEQVWVEADVARMEQVFDNLMLNALKFTPEHGSVRVRVHGKASDAVLEVSDSGVGMSADLVANVFELFTQGSEKSGRDGGLGIGLAVVRRLVELHGGRVEAHSDGPGRGSTFLVRLPRVDAPIHEEATGPATDASRHKRYRVLLVEDNEDAREAVRLLLEAAGHMVHVAKTGQAALEAAVSFDPDVGLVDIGLPDVDGYEVARCLRTKFGATLRLIALTGYGQPEDRRRVVEAGFDAHVVKPVDPDELSRILTA
jgi:PAS domain S-box-containing protein